MLSQRDSLPGALGAEIREDFPEQVTLGVALEPRAYFP